MQFFNKQEIGRFIGENMIFDRQQLEAFAAVVEMRHFGHAASELKITRGAISQRLKSLEGTLNGAAR